MHVRNCCSFDVESTTVVDHDDNEQNEIDSDDDTDVDSSDQSFENNQEIFEKIIIGIRDKSNRQL